MSYIYCYSMGSGDSKNVYGNPRLQRPDITLKLPMLRNFSVKCGHCNLELTSTFSESTGITQSIGFPHHMTCLTLSDIKTHRD